MGSLTRLISPPLRPATTRPRRLRAAGALRPPPLVPHFALRRLPPVPKDRAVEHPAPVPRVVPAPADRDVRRGPDRAAARPTAPRTTTEQAPPARAPVARRSSDAAAGAPAPPPTPPRARTRTTAERVQQQPAARAVLPETTEPRAVRPPRPQTSASASVLAAPQLRPATAPRSSAANDAPLRRAPPRPLAVPTAETHASRPAVASRPPLPAVAPPPAPPVQTERPPLELRAPPPPPVPVRAAPPPLRERVVQLREVVHEQAQPAAPATQVRPAPAQLPATVVHAPSAPPSTRAPVTIEIGRVEIRAAPPRSAAPVAGHATPPRPHSIDPGVRFTGARW